MLLISLSFKAKAQTQYDLDFYLIDSLPIPEMIPAETALLDTNLTKFHQANEDTLRLFYLENIVENCINDAIWPAYNQLLLQLAEEGMAKVDSGSKSYNRALH